MPARAGHRHTHPELTAGARHRRPLALAFALTVVVLVAEVVGALMTNSLALLSDAGHMLTDVGGLGMALAAIAVARRPGASQRSFGLYRLEILAALANALLLVGVGVYVLLEALDRLRDPQDVAAGAVIVVATVGLIANLVAFSLLRAGAGESLNIRGAYLEVVADLLGSVGVLVAAVVLAVTGWPYIDPIVAVVIGLAIVPRALQLGREALRVLLQAAPPQIAVETVRRELAALPGVVDVHDLHVWTLTSAMEVASAHLMIGDEVDPHAVLDDARALLRDRYGLAHATLQVEPDTHEGCEELHW